MVLSGLQQELLGHQEHKTVRPQALSNDLSTMNGFPYFLIEWNSVYPALRRDGLARSGALTELYTCRMGNMRGANGSEQRNGELTNCEENR